MAGTQEEGLLPIFLNLYNLFYFLPVKKHFSTSLVLVFIHGPIRGAAADIQPWWYVFRWYVFRCTQLQINIAVSDRLL